MYQAIITEDFLKLLQQYKGDLSKVPGERSLNADPFFQLLTKKEIRLEPVFPDINDPEMARHYRISFKKKPTPDLVAKIQQSSALESFYEKPGDELPM